MLPFSDCRFHLLDEFKYQNYKQKNAYENPGCKGNHPAVFLFNVSLFNQSALYKVALSKASGNKKAEIP